MPRLTDFQRQLSVALLDQGLRPQDVANRIGCHVTTIRWLRRRVVDTGSTRDRPRSGRPRVTNNHQDRIIHRSHIRTGSGLQLIQHDRRLGHMGDKSLGAPSAVVCMRKGCEREFRIEDLSWIRQRGRDDSDGQEPAVDGPWQGGGLSSSLTRPGSVYIAQIAASMSGDAVESASSVTVSGRLIAGEEPASWRGPRSPSIQEHPW